MSVPRIRLETVEAIARKILMEYDSSLLSGEPRPIPIEAIIEVKFDLILEYHILRKNGAVLGETIFDDGPVILYANSLAVAQFNVNKGALDIGSSPGPYTCPW